MLATMGWKSTLVVAVGLLLCMKGFVLFVLWPHLAKSIIFKQLVLKPGSVSFEHWQETPVPMYIDIYFHNWTNPLDIRSQIPHFTQMGPYRFYERRTKVDLVWNANKTVSYRQTRHWVFDPEHSVGSLKDQVTNVNVVALTVAHKSRFKSYMEKRSISFSLSLMGQALHVTKTVEELLFQGYTDSLIKSTHILPDILKDGAKTYDRFGWFYQRNGSTEIDGLFNMATGEDDMSQLGEILSWNYSNKTDYFEGQCGQVRGKSGEMFSPGLPKDKPVGLFSPDLCRMIELDYEGEESVWGVKGNRYEGGRRMFGEPCLGKAEPVPHGLLNLTACRWGVPIFFSCPHFLDADPGLQQAVNGMNPDPQQHSFSLTVEPTYGIPIDLKARFQLNLMMTPMNDYNIFRGIKKTTFMPIMWFDQRASLTHGLGLELRALLWVPTMGLLVAGLLVITGLGLGLYEASRLARRRLNPKLQPAAV